MSLPLVLCLRPVSGFSGRMFFSSARRSPPLTTRLAESSGLPPEAVQSLLRGVLSRAKSTLSQRINDSSSSTQTEMDLLLPTDRNATTSAESTKDLLNAVASRTKRTVSTLPQHQTPTEITTTTNTTTTLDNYNQNPAISLTALAQWLWASVLRPHEDSAIDATCGNGNDSKGIARILFGNPHLCLGPEPAQLICIDIQEQACRNTQSALEQILPPSLVQENVIIRHGSHDPLPRPDNGQPGLVVYNLGYLPQSDKAYQTQVSSTLASITEALLMIRLGGMVSVMTYPASNRREDQAVRWLLEAAVVMTNKQGPDWETFVKDPSVVDCDEDLRTLLQTNLQRMAEFYQTQQRKRTFRVTEHKKIGLASAPILITATRIK